MGAWLDAPTADAITRGDSATRPHARAGSLAGHITGIPLAPGARPPTQAPDAHAAAASAPSQRASEIVVYLETTDPAQRFAPPADHAAVSQKGAQFSPPLLIVSVGQTVDFHNDEDRPIEHNVFSQSPAMPFDLGLYRPGLSKSVTFDKPGPVRLYCSIHRYMDGVIFVCPTPFFARVGPQGDFEIAGVPPGKYVLKTWQKQKRCPELSVNVRISAGKSTHVALEMKRK